MFRNFMILIVMATLAISGCGSKAKPIAHDTTTPEGALLCIEDAYREKNLNKVLACKDFQIEGRLMIGKLKTKDENGELAAKTAEVLELGFRKEIEQRGFPDMTGVTSEFPETKTFQDGIVIVTEVCRYPDGGASKQRMLVGKSAQGWRVLYPVDE